MSNFKIGARAYAHGCDHEALRPKPVVKTRTFHITEGYHGWTEPADPSTNLKLTFTDGKLTDAEVLK